MVQFQSAVSNQITYTISEQQYMAAMRQHSRTQFKRLPLVFGLLVFSGLCLTAIGSIATALGMLIGFSAYIALILYFVRRNIAKMYRSMPQLHGDFTVQFAEDGLVLHSSYALSKVKWQLFQKYSVDDNMYLLYQGPNLFNMIPRSAFHSADQEAAFRMLLELNVRSASKPRSKRMSY